MDSFTVKKSPVRGRRRRNSSSRLRPEPSSAPRFNLALPDLPWKQIVFFAVGILVAVGIIAFVLKMLSLYNTMQIKRTNTDNKATTVQKAVEKDTYTILLTGYGGPTHEGSYLTDTIILAHIDKKKKKVILFSVPRDLWVKIPSKSGEDDDGFYSKINAAYQMGLFPDNYPDLPDEYHGKDNAPQLLKDLIAQVTGLRADYFVGIDFDGFEQVIDTLGGIEVTVKRSFDDYYYPITGKETDICGREPKPTLTEDQVREEQEKYDKMNEEEKKAYDDRPVDQLNENQFQELAREKPEEAYPCRYEHLHFDAGPMKMDGKTALKFARSRKSLQDGGDFNRAARQQLVIEAVKTKILSIGFLPKILPLLDTLSENIRTDIPLDEIQHFIGQAAQANDYKIDHYVFSNEETLDIDTSDDGQSILVSRDGEGKWDITRKVVKNVLAGISPTPTPSITPRVTKSPSPKVTKTSTEE